MSEFFKAIKHLITKTPLPLFLIIALLEGVGLWNGTGFVGTMLYKDSFKGFVEMLVMAAVAIYLPYDAKDKHWIIVTLYVLMEVWALGLLANASYFAMRESIDPGQLQWIVTSIIWGVHVDVIMTLAYTYVLPAMTLSLLIGFMYGRQKKETSDKEKFLAFIELAQKKAKAEGKPMSLSKLMEELDVTDK